MLARARKRSPDARLLLGDAQWFPFSESFDAAVISLALHEMEAEAREQVWEEISRVVRPGGTIIVADFTVPTRSTSYSRWIGSFIESDEHGMGKVHPAHYRNYREFMSQGGLSAWLQGHGCALLREGRYLGGHIGVAAVRNG
jgi:ubiquinone/menaquinone biosynthesis C-methylase UbiE